MINVVFKTPLATRLGICIYKTSLLHRPDDYICFTPSCPPTFYNKIVTMRQITPFHSPASFLTCALDRGFVIFNPSQGIFNFFMNSGYSSLEFGECTCIKHRGMCDNFNLNMHTFPCSGIDSSTQFVS